MMDSSEKQLVSLYRELKAEMTNNILPFWMNRAFDSTNGSFYGQILNDETIVPDSPKGAVLNARILWAFSAAYNETGRAVYLEYARKAFNYFSVYFMDEQYGGVYWSINANGSMRNGRKQVYAQAFAIYAFAEYYVASGDQDSILLASDLFGFIEKHALNAEFNGYIEALSRDWKSLEDLRLSEKDANEPKSMNTHLHILEAYTRLFEVWKDDELASRLHNLVKIHTDHILSPDNGHFNLFFGMNWEPRSEHYSYGHDIEGAWLIQEAAHALGLKSLTEEIEQLAVQMAETTLLEGIATDGSIYNEGLYGKITDKDRHWWPQAEAIIGFLNAWEISGNPKYLLAATRVWDFIKKHMRHPSGEWWWLVNDKYEPDLSQDLAGEWKCPYHNTRCCIEVMKRISKRFEKNKFPEFINTITE